jgi:hypothetical protein
VFVGSSSEGEGIADAVQVLLDDECQVELWTQGTFGLSENTLSALVGALVRFDFAILVVTADDATTSRGVTEAAPRDNILFELGFFMGGLGPSRTFILTDRTNPPKLPSDLAGVSRAEFRPHSTGNLQAALGAPCSKIKEAMKRLGRREVSEAKRLGQAAGLLEESGGTLDRLINLLVRSRKVELDVIIGQFGGLIDSERLSELSQDLEDFEAALEADGNAE